MDVKSIGLELEDKAKNIHLPRISDVSEKFKNLKAYMKKVEQKINQEVNQILAERGITSLEGAEREQFNKEISPHIKKILEYHMNRYMGS